MFLLKCFVCLKNRFKLLSGLLYSKLLHLIPNQFFTCHFYDNKCWNPESKEHIEKKIIIIINFHSSLWQKKMCCAKEQQNSLRLFERNLWSIIHFVLKVSEVIFGKVCIIDLLSMSVRKGLQIHVSILRLSEENNIQQFSSGFSGFCRYVLAYKLNGRIYIAVFLKYLTIEC